MATIALTPLPKAVQSFEERKVFPSGMTSQDWENEPAAIRQRLFFSARVEEERILSAMHQKLQTRIRLAESEGATMDKSRFIAEMQQMLTQEGYRRSDDVKKGSLRDLKGYRRLSLIWEMNLAQAQGYAKHAAGMTKDGMANEPCQELIRMMDRRVERDWPRIWQENGGAFYGEPGVDYPKAPGRMIALKTSPIWTRISRFNTPWPPFDWGSGMGLAGVDIDEAEELGVVTPDDDLTPTAIPFNENLQASAEEIDVRGLEKLRSDFGDHIKIDNGKITFNNTPSNELAKSITQTLTNRAREIAARGRNAYDGLRREDEAALTRPVDEREIIASTSAVAVGRKLLYHEEWGADEETHARIIASFLPDNVTVALIDGHIYAYRKDIIGVSVEGIHQMSLNSTNGMLLGYGANLFDADTVGVSFMVGDEVVGGFYGPRDHIKTYARARMRDFTDALGVDVKVKIDQKEVRL